MSSFRPALTHATGFRSRAAGLIYFDTTRATCPASVTFGDLTISYLVWDAAAGVEPALAASKLAEDLGHS